LRNLSYRLTSMRLPFFNMHDWLRSKGGQWLRNVHSLNLNLPRDPPSGFEEWTPSKFLCKPTRSFSFYSACGALTPNRKLNHSGREPLNPGAVSASALLIQANEQLRLFSAGHSIGQDIVPHSADVAEGDPALGLELRCERFQS
jgi:hypothetical protein